MRPIQDYNSVFNNKNRGTYNSISSIEIEVSITKVPIQNMSSCGAQNL